MKAVRFLLKAVGVVVAVVVVMILYVVASGGVEVPKEASATGMPPAPPGMKEGKAEVAPGVQLYYREAGQGTPVLLIHGTGANADCWFDSFNALSKSHRVIAYDRRGYTRSAAAPLTEVATHYHQQAEDAAKLLEQLQIPTATIIGWSGGGVIAMDLAIHHPEKVTGMVLMEPPYKIPEHITPAMGLTFAKIGILSKTRGAEAGAATFYRWATGRTDGKDTISAVPEMMRKEMLDNSKTTMFELDAQANYDDDQVKTINKPVLLLTGAYSQPNFHMVADKLKTLLPQVTVAEMPNSSHFMQFDAQPEFTKAAVEFVDKIAPTPPPTAVANAPAPAAPAPAAPTPAAPAHK